MSHGVDNLQLEFELVATTREILAEYLPEDEKPQGTMAALESHEDMLEKAEYTVDVSDYPVDVADVIDHVCRLWLLTPPSKTNKKEYANWIKESRSILDACAEHRPIDVLQRVYTDYAMRTAENYGTAPYTVGGPSALVKACRAKAGQLRGETTNDSSRESGKDESSFYF